MDSAIEISSNSDVEIQETRSSLPPSLPHLRLPQASHRREIVSALRPHLVSGTSSNANGLTRVGALPLPSSRNGFEAKPLTNGHIGSQQALKRVLPPSVARPPIPLRPDIVGTSNGNGSHFRGVYATPAVSASCNNGNVGGSYGGFHDGISMGRVINGDKLFPPSGEHGTAASTSHFNGGDDPLHMNGIGEDRSSENDERLVYQTALQASLPYTNTRVLERDEL